MKYQYATLQLVQGLVGGYSQEVLPDGTERKYGGDMAQAVVALNELSGEGWGVVACTGPIGLVLWTLQRAL